jgi:putative PIN family toxin of toxin-antitoxin system
MKSLLAIIDTNVLLSGLKSRKGQSYKLLQKLLNNEFEIAISVPIILEYEAILKKKLDKTIYSEEDIESVINYLCKIGKQVKIFYLWRPFLKDPFDDHIIEAALTANCKYIITYNKKDFMEVEQFGIRVLTPYDFMQRLGG